MPFFADAISDGAYILIEYSGKLTRKEIEAGQSSTQALLARSNYGKLLIDFTAMSRLKSRDDIYFIAESFKVCSPGMKIGLVIPKELQWCAEFVERLAANRGLRLNVFADRQTARIWLLGDQDTIKESE
jgi:hypothetical protein